MKENSKLKRGLAIALVVLLVGLYISTLVFAIIGSGLFMTLFTVSLAATVAVPIIIHLFLMLLNVRNGRSLWANPYTYRDAPVSADGNNDNVEKQ